jgi:hypothetical protein
MRTGAEDLKDHSKSAIFMEKPTDLREFLGIGAKIRSLLGCTATGDPPL